MHTNINKYTMGKSVSIQTLVFVFFLGGLSACSSMLANSDTPEGAFAVAQNYENSDRYEEAIQRYQEIKNKYPYSTFAIKSELAIADVYYKQESFGEAQIAYQTFRELHPKHAQSDYVQYRYAMSIFSQLPDTIDRDLSLAPSAIKEFNQLAKEYPQSQYIQEANDKKQACLRMLAEKEDYIASFYLKRKIYESALSRFEDLYKKHKGLGFEAKALYGAALSAHKLGIPDKFKLYSEELFTAYNNSEEANRLRKDLKNE
ncbi:MAG TPA: outer membrane protein assembly factor BamD [Pseudobdellovibrionaceae bacterium]|nr:outer membrane protein assembly factor BamD [Pseudobdellovibrionaceae bacterium]